MLPILSDERYQWPLSYAVSSQSSGILFQLAAFHILLMDSSPFDDSPADSDPTPNNVALLKRAWRNECTAPEILAYETDLVSAVMDQIRNLVRKDFNTLCSTWCKPRISRKI